MTKGGGLMTLFAKKDKCKVHKIRQEQFNGTIANASFLDLVQRLKARDTFLKDMLNKHKSVLRKTSKPVCFRANQQSNVLDCERPMSRGMYVPAENRIVGMKISSLYVQFYVWLYQSWETIEDLGSATEKIELINSKNNIIKKLQSSENDIPKINYLGLAEMINDCTDKQLEAGKFAQIQDVLEYLDEFYEDVMFAIKSKAPEVWNWYVKETEQRLYLRTSQIHNEILSDSQRQRNAAIVKEQLESQQKLEAERAFKCKNVFIDYVCTGNNDAEKRKIEQLCGVGCTPPLPVNPRIPQPVNTRNVQQVNIDVNNVAIENDSFKPRNNNDNSLSKEPQANLQKRTTGGSLKSKIVFKSGGVRRYVVRLDESNKKYINKSGKVYLQDIHGKYRYVA